LATDLADSTFVVDDARRDADVRARAVVAAEERQGVIHHWIAILALDEAPVVGDAVSGHAVTNLAGLAVVVIDTVSIAISVTITVSVSITVAVTISVSVSVSITITVSITISVVAAD
jgi:hypothetical protein